ncbi:MAG: tyrosine-type recombinase/integrase, partial [Bacteroidales bacterium]|nr:tyrosine-type recombinase/integrase [Bacteroidales bacterium]
KTDCTASHINIVSSKDVEALKIPLSKRAKLLLKKHKDTNTETAFPLPCMEVANRHLKTIGMLAKLDRVLTDVYFKNGKRVTETKQLFQKLTTHVARKTFVTQSIAKGISPAVIMKITGHADYKTMQNYIDVAGDTVTKEMEKLNKL